MDKNDILFFMIVGLALIAFAFNVYAENLTLGECIQYGDSNGTITEFCAPPKLGGLIQLHPAAFGIAEVLNFTCFSGELVNNAPPIFMNQTIIQFINVTQYIDRNFTVERNITVYVNNTVQNSTTVSKIYDLRTNLTYGEEFLDFDSKLQIKCPPFPKINDNKLLSGGEIARYDGYNLVVACLNTTAFCAPQLTSVISNETYCDLKVNSAILNVSQQFAARLANITPQPVASAGTNFNDWLIILVPALIIGYLYYEKKIKKANQEIAQAAV